MVGGTAVSLPFPCSTERGGPGVSTWTACWYVFVDPQRVRRSAGVGSFGRESESASPHFQVAVIVIAQAFCAFSRPGGPSHVSLQEPCRVSSVRRPRRLADGPCIPAYPQR